MTEQSGDAGASGTGQRQSGLLQLELEITGRCNLHCEHCYVGDAAADMDAAMARRVLQDAAALGVRDVVLTGGEPFMAPELLSELADFGQLFDYRLGLLTNGLLIKREHIALLSRFDYVQMSIDAPPGIAGKRTDCARQVIETADLLRSRGLHVSLLCTVDRANLQYVESLAAFAAELDITLGFNRFVPVGRGSARRDHAFSAAEMCDVTTRLCQLRDEYPGRVLFSCPLTVLVDSRRQTASREASKSIVGGCIAGVAACVVTMSGDVYPCPFLRVPSGSLREQTLPEIWFGSGLLRSLRDRGKLKGACGGCRYRSICGGCRASAYAFSGDILGTDPQCFIDLLSSHLPNGQETEERP